MLAGLGGGWLLATRVGLPLAYNDLPSRDNRRGEYRFGASDLLVQGIFIVRYAFDIAGSGNRRHISKLQFHPAAHFNFGSGRFITLPVSMTMVPG